MSSPTMGWSRVAQASTDVSAKRHTLTGLHLQESPHWETKLVRCTTGAAIVVATDLREDSPTRLRWVGVELSAQNRRVLCAGGFAQGYQTLADETELFYQCRANNNPAAARGVRWDDPALAIKWPPAAERMLSDRTGPGPCCRARESGQTRQPGAHLANRCGRLH